METFPSLSNYYLEPGIASYSEKSLYIQTFFFGFGYTVFLIAAETALALIMASVYYNLGSVYF